MFGILSFKGTVREARLWIQAIKKLEQAGIIVNHKERVGAVSARLNHIYIGGVA